MTVDSAPYTIATPNRVRKVMASRMRASATELPQVTLNATADAGQLLAMRATPPAGTGAKVTVTVRLLTVVARVLRQHERINSCVIDGETRLYTVVNLGVAMATSHGLVVPVIHDAASKSLEEIAALMTDLRERAEARRLGYEDMSDATFSVTNLGAYGVEHFTPLVNPPQVAILGLGAATVRPTLGADGALVRRQELPLSLTFDHAAVDGAEAALFLQDLSRTIESPPDP